MSQSAALVWQEERTLKGSVPPCYVGRKWAIKTIPGACWQAWWLSFVRQNGSLSDGSRKSLVTYKRKGDIPMPGPVSVLEGVILRKLTLVFREHPQHIVCCIINFHTLII